MHPRDKIKSFIQKDLYKNLATNGRTLRTHRTYSSYINLWTRRYMKHFKDESKAIEMMEDIGFSLDLLHEAYYPEGLPTLEAVNDLIYKLACESVNWIYEDLGKIPHIKEERQEEFKSEYWRELNDYSDFLSGLYDFDEEQGRYIKPS